MNRDWIAVIVAAVFEVIWVAGLKHADQSSEWAITAAAIIISFYLMIKAGERLPVGTVYAVFVGLGTAGTVAAEMIWFSEQIRPAKILLIALLLSGVIGLKATTPSGERGA